MGLGTSKAARNDAVFVDLKFAPNKGEDMVGFRQTISRTPREGVKEGEKKYDYKYQTYNYVDGELSAFRVKEESNFEDPTQKDLIGYAVIRDVGATEPAPDVVIRFPLLNQAGRRMVGLLSAAVTAKAGAIHLYTNFAEAGAQIGDKVLDKPGAFLNCKVGDSRGEKLTPLYYDEKGEPLLEADGKPTKLPMGEKHVIARKEVWDFTKADEVVASTAALLEDAFKRDTHAHEEAPAADDDVDLNEAAGAAMRG